MQKSENTTRLSAGEIRENRKRRGTKTNWERLDALTDEDVEQQAIADYEEHGYPDYARGSWVGLPPDIDVEKQQLTVRYDKKVVDYFKSTGKGYQTRMNAVLREYVEHQLKRDAS